VSSFESRDPDLDFAAALSVFELNWLARRQSNARLIELVTVSAQPANQEAAGNGITFMKSVALSARIEDRVDRAVVSARKDEANEMAGAIAVAKKLR
jgi:hypothetical protein